jgi:hypothetical protein
MEGPCPWGVAAIGAAAWAGRRSEVWPSREGVAAEPSWAHSHHAAAAAAKVARRAGIAAAAAAAGRSSGTRQEAGPGRVDAAGGVLARAATAGRRRVGVVALLAAEVQENPAGSMDSLSV